MTAPNLVSITTVTAKTAVQAVTTSATAIASNSTSSGKAVKVSALYLSNIGAGDSAATVDVDMYRSSTAYHIAKTISIPADTTLDVLSKSVFLEEGDSLRLTASADGFIEAVCSYEEIS